MLEVTQKLSHIHLLYLNNKKICGTTALSVTLSFSVLLSRQNGSRNKKLSCNILTKSVQFLCHLFSTTRLCLVYNFSSMRINHITPVKLSFQPVLYHLLNVCWFTYSSFFLYNYLFIQRLFTDEKRL